MMNHSECSHPKTKAARAKCRKERAAAKPQISWFIMQDAYAMNDMWGTLNTRQERLLNLYEVRYATCEYCGGEEIPVFVLPNTGVNVCGNCERTHDVHKYEEAM